MGAFCIKRTHQRVQQPEGVPDNRSVGPHYSRLQSYRIWPRASPKAPSRTLRQAAPSSWSLTSDSRAGSSS